VLSTVYQTKLKMQFQLSASLLKFGAKQAVNSIRHSGFLTETSRSVTEIWRLKSCKKRFRCSAQRNKSNRVRENSSHVPCNGTRLSYLLGHIYSCGYCSVVSSTPPTSPSPPTCTISNGRAVVRLNRPEHHNRIEPGDLVVLRQILEEVDANDGVRVLILTGAGSTFSAGYDLLALAAAANGQQGAADVHEFEALVDRIEKCRVTTICGLNGPVYGGASDLALACDFRVGVASARMAVPAAELGVHVYHGGLRRFVTRLGLGAAKRLLLLAQSIDSSEMLRIGFLDEIVDTSEALQQRIHALADVLVAAPAPAAVYGMKQALNRIAQGEMAPGATNAAWAESVRSPIVAAAATERLARRRRTPKVEKK
jgi:enoyl-CoA hydratase